MPPKDEDQDYFRRREEAARCAADGATDRSARNAQRTLANLYRQRLKDAAPAPGDDP